MGCVSNKRKEGVVLVLESGASVTVLIDSGSVVLFRTANIQKNEMGGHLDGRAVGQLVFLELLSPRRLLVRTEVRREGGLTVGSTR